MRLDLPSVKTIGLGNTKLNYVTLVICFFGVFKQELFRVAGSFG